MALSCSPASRKGGRTLLTGHGSANDLADLPSGAPVKLLNYVVVNDCGRVVKAKPIIRSGCGGSVSTAFDRCSLFVLYPSRPRSIEGVVDDV
jgi:hypothetical protein